MVERVPPPISIIEPELRVLLDTATAWVDAQIPYGENRFLGERTRRIFNVVARDALVAQGPLHADDGSTALQGRTSRWCAPPSVPSRTSPRRTERRVRCGIVP